MIGQKCFQASVVNPRVSCPIGFYAQGLDCVRKLEFDPVPVCPDATTPTTVNGVEVCQGKEFVKKEFTCTDPTATVELMNGVKKCKSHTRIVASDTCPPGWTYVAAVAEVPEDLVNGVQFQPAKPAVCKKEQFKAVDHHCDFNKGERLEWSVKEKRFECVQISISNGTYGCPPETTLQRGRCVSTKVFDHVEVCHKKHQKLINHVCVETQFEQLHTDCEDGNYDPVNEICYINVNKEVDFDCPAGCRHIKGTTRCFCETKSEPISYCGSGCEMVAGKCEKDEVIAGKAICPDGSGYAGQGLCEHKEVVDPLRACHSGHVLENGFCYVANDISPSYVCPDGFVETNDNRCVLHTEAPLLH